MEISDENRWFTPLAFLRRGPLTIARAARGELVWLRETLGEPE